MKKLMLLLFSFSVLIALTATAGHPPGKEKQQTHASVKAKIQTDITVLHATTVTEIATDIGIPVANSHEALVPRTELKIGNSERVLTLYPDLLVRSTVKRSENKIRPPAIYNSNG